VRSESRCALRLWYEDLVVSIEVVFEVCCVSMYSVFKQQFLLTMVLSIEKRVFLVEYVFRECNRYTDLVQEQFAEKFPDLTLPDFYLW
jgi:hypothetical protein